MNPLDDIKSLSPQMITGLNTFIKHFLEVRESLITLCTNYEKMINARKFSLSRGLDLDEISILRRKIEDCNNIQDLLAYNAEVDLLFKK